MKAELATKEFEIATLKEALHKKDAEQKALQSKFDKTADLSAEKRSMKAGRRF